MSQYSMIAVVVFVMVAAIVMAYCQREEMDADKGLNRYGFKVSYIRNWFVFVVCAVVIAFSLGTNANAGENDPEWNPPTRYDHKFDGELRVIRVPVQDVSKTCEAMWRFFGGKQVLNMPRHGCAKRQDDDKGKYCVVVIPKGNVQKATPAAILRHEIGHCNGWSGKHEG